MHAASLRPTYSDNNINMTVHKIYVDSRAAKEGTASDFVWAPDRPLSVDKCRAFIDSVHMPITWGTITDNNKFL